MENENRFYFIGTRIDGYYGIYDKKNEDDTIWIDCPREYIKTIVIALNKEHGKKDEQ